MAEKLGVPLIELDTFNYHDEVSENDKYYIAYHAIMSYLDISPSYVPNFSIDQHSKLDEIIVKLQDKILWIKS